ncbi:MAG TPA: glycosyltransferase family 4 protein [Polyangiaceae bacterium]|nr:glycosyltransferase family 4 protein [Polyangiaceae bacterium]
MSRPALVAPSLPGPITGGTLYDRELLRALERAGDPCERLSLEDATRESGDPRRILIVDTLFLDDVPRLARPGGASVVLLAHYLPSLVERGDAFTPDDLSASERAALRVVSGVIAPSPFMAGVLGELLGPSVPVRVVEPGIDTLTDGCAPSPAPPLEVLVVANALPGKGLVPFFAALATELDGAPGRPRVTLVTNFELDPGYGRTLRDLLSRPPLQDSVHVVDPGSRAELLRLVATRHVFLSASRMESFGMAIAEARAAGVPVLARRGGNVRALVDPASGGALFDDDRSLAAAVVALSSDPGALAERRRLAVARRLRRSWEDAARDFSAALEAFR